MFAGGWTLTGAGAICDEGADEFKTLDLLTQLVEKSLVLVQKGPTGETRYRMLDTVRQYGLEKLEEFGEADTLRERHYRYYVVLAETAENERRGENQGRWRDRLEAEHDNLLAAASWTGAGPEEPSPALRLCGHLGWFWLTRGYISLGRSLLTEALARRRGDAERVPGQGADPDRGAGPGPGQLCRRPGAVPGGTSHLPEPR